MKQMSNVVQTCGQPAPRSTAILTPSASRTSALPLFLDIARLPCFATGTPQLLHNDRTCRGNIELANSVSRLCRTYPAIFFARVTSGCDFLTHDLSETGNFLHGLALDPECRQQSSDLRMRRLPSIIVFITFRASCLSSDSAFLTLRDRRLIMDLSPFHDSSSNDRCNLVIRNIPIALTDDTGWKIASASTNCL